MASAPFANRLCELLGIRHPILLAGMAGGPTTPELVAAVSEAGGLGTLGLTGMSADAAADAVERTRRLTSAPIAANVIVAPPTPPDRRGHDPDAALAPLRRELGLGSPPPAPAPATPRALVSAALEAGARVVSVGLGDPGDVHDLAEAVGAPVIAMVSSVDDAVRSVQSGADVVVAQGSEAGGHRSSFDLPEDGEVPLVGTFALVPQVVRAVSVPVVATGGVMDGRGLAAALALGAQGVQMGTRFLVAAESGVPEGYRRRLREAHDVDTVITRAISGRPARSLPNRLLAALEAAGPPALGFPHQAAASADLRAAAAAVDRPDMIALWAGQAAGLADGAPPAARIVEEVVAEAAATLRELAGPLADRG
jgi:nitronate monooxygenase